MGEANPIRFSSEYHEEVTGLVYYGYRYYAPETHRWLSRDPIGHAGGLNLYGFVGNDPVNGVDELGLAVGDWYDPRTYWNEGFLEGWSKGGQGVINAFTGGLFDAEAGFFYEAFDKSWQQTGHEGIRCDRAFQFGNNGGRVAVGALAVAGGAAYGPGLWNAPLSSLPNAATVGEAVMLPVFAAGAGAVVVAGSVSAGAEAILIFYATHWWATPATIGIANEAYAEMSGQNNFGPGPVYGGGPPAEYWIDFLIWAAGDAPDILSDYNPCWVAPHSQEQQL